MSWIFVLGENFIFSYDIFVYCIFIFIFVKYVSIIFVLCCMTFGKLHGNISLCGSFLL